PPAVGDPARPADRRTRGGAPRSPAAPPPYRLLDPLRRLLERAGGRRNPDEVLLRVAELLDDALPHADPVERAADGVHRRGLLEAHLDQGPAREVDAVLEPALPGDVTQAGQGHDQRDHVRPVALVDEVVLRVGEDLHHLVAPSYPRLRWTTFG